MNNSGHRERLKTKLMKSKKGTLADYELLEVLLFFVQPRSDVQPLAKNLLRQFGNLSGVLFLADTNLKCIEGIGPSTATLFRCIQEVLERTSKDKIKEGPIINNWKALMEYIQISIGKSPIEQMRILYMNKKHMLLNDELQDVGTIDQTPFYTREVIKKALAIGATSIIMSHNHPSGDPSPSAADIEMTKKMVIACNSIDIKLIDHIIVSHGRYFSFKSEGII